MKTRGFALIELVMVMNILALIFTVFLSFNNFEKKISYQIDSDYASSEIQNIFTFSKVWCKSKKKYGSIKIYKDKKKIYFTSSDGNTIKKIQLPDSIDIFISGISKSNITTIPISEIGRIDKSLTIKVKNKLNKIIEVTISVGVDKVDIKDERKYDEILQE